MLSATYKRHLSQSYMILEEEEIPLSYECKILSYNRIKGFLPMETEVSDGAIRLWYEITGKQSFSDYLGRRQMDMRLLCRFFQALKEVCRMTNDYLLEENGILLDFNYIYMNFEQKNIEFVYFPGRKEDLREYFRKIMEQVLQKLDHDDKQAVAAAYEVYQHSLQDGQSLEEMLRYGESGESEEPRREWVEESFHTDGEEPQEAYRFKPCGERRPEGSGNCQSETTETKQTGGWQPKPPGVEKKISRVFAKTTDILRRRAGFHREEKEDFLVRLKDVQFEPEIVMHPTELLHEDREVQGLLLYQGKENREDLRIDKQVFLIGKKESEVDGLIDSGCISRIHAKIELEKGEYYITDMNSTNGTYLNGERLEYRQRACLKPGDQVAFGRVDYRFQ